MKDVYLINALLTNLFSKREELNRFNFCNYKLSLDYQIKNLYFIKTFLFKESMLVYQMICYLLFNDNPV